MNNRYFSSKNRETSITQCVYSMQAKDGRCKNYPEGAFPDCEDMFGGIFLSMYTLFQARALTARGWEIGKSLQFHGCPCNFINCFINSY